MHLTGSAVQVLHALMLSVQGVPAVPKDPGQNYLVNTEGVPEWLKQGAICGQ